MSVARRIADRRLVRAAVIALAAGLIGPRPCGAQTPDCVPEKGDDCNGNGWADACEFEASPSGWRIVERYIVGDEPRDSTVADLDGDGRSDVAVAMGTGRAISVLYGESTRSFSGPRAYGDAVGARSIVHGDWNEDGRLDLAFGHLRSAHVTFLLGEGDRQFASSKAEPAALPNGPRSLLVADLDADGHSDLIVLTGNFSGTIARLRGHGDGSFEPAETIIDGSGFIPSSIAVANLDDDVFPDIVFSSRAVFYGTGESFEEGVELESPGGTGVAIADFDEDGSPDLAFSSREGVTLFLGDGARGFEEQPTDSIGQTGFATAGDVNGDGHMDVVAGAGFVLLGDGRGALDPVAHFRVGRGVPIVDLLGDEGSVDLVAIREPGAIEVARRSVDHVFEAPIRVAELDADIRWVTHADLDANGHVDSVVGTWLDLVVVLREGDGAFLSRITLDVPSEQALVAVFDTDGDGALDIVAASSGRLSVWAGRGDGTFDEETVVVEETFPDPGFLATGDFDRDGVTDVLVSYSGTLDVIHFRGTAVGGFEAGEPLVSTEDRSRLVVSDFNGDGILDVAAGGRDPQIAVFAGREDGSFAPPQVTALPGGPRGGLAATDFDGDGRAELVAAWANRVATLYPRDDLRFRIGPGFDTRFEVWSFELLQVDADGLVDIAYSEETGEELSFRLGTGDGEFVEERRVPGGARWSLQTIDADGDGVDDLSVYVGKELRVIGSDTRPFSRDCDGDGVPDSCNLESGELADCDRSGVPDACEIRDGMRADCNENGVPDRCDLATGTSADVDADAVPDECQDDCDGNDVPDSADIASGNAADCNENGVPDRCDVASGDEDDCNRNGVPDACEEGGDRNENGILDECESGGQVPGDCNQDGNLDLSDGICVLGFLFLGTPAALPCAEAAGNTGLLDWQGDGSVDLSDAVAVFGFLFLTGPPHPLNVEGGCVPLLLCPERCEEP